jgi:hypothetical protein
VAALAPALLYNAWVFLWSPGFGVFSSPRYASSRPSLLELALAIGPATLVALLALRGAKEADDVAGRHRTYLALWAALALALVVVQPVSFALQFIAGVGAPLLILAAIGLGRLRRGALEVAVLLFAGTALTETWLQLSPNPYRNVPEERWRVAEALGGTCQRGEIVVAPPDVGLYVGGLSACWPWVSHSFSPDHAARDAATRRFYASSPEERLRFLEDNGVAHVVVPAGWAGGGLPPGGPYERRLEVEGARGGLAVYSRTADPPPPVSP